MSVPKTAPENAPATGWSLEYPRPAVAVDLAIFTIVDADLKVLLIRRGEEPFKGGWALPGGFVRVGPSAEEQGEDLDAAAQRELTEETGLRPGAAYLAQLHTFGRAGRDPRHRVITVAYYALVRPTLAPLIHAGGDAASAEWHSVGRLPRRLAFDHREILDAALERIRDQVDESDIAFELVPETFSIPELRSVHEAIKGTAYDPGNFRRRFKRMQTDGFIVQEPGRRIGPTKPAAVYRFSRRKAEDRPAAPRSKKAEPR